MLVIGKLITTLLGLTLPGYLLARILRQRHSWALAFPLSALLLVEIVIALAIAGLPIRLDMVAILLTLCVVIFLIVMRVKMAAAEVETSSHLGADLPKWLTTAILLFVLAILSVIAIRTTLFPLSGFDNFFRWDALAREMFMRQSLAFYPPVESGDYVIYLYTDGIPPLVATIYWWIYAVFGKIIPQTTSISVILQLGSALALTYQGARHAFGRRVACIALLITATSPLLLNAFAIGQETGFTTLAIAGQLYFALAASRHPSKSLVIVAALFAVLGSLARDYGPALAICGFATLAWYPQTRRYLPTFCLFVIVLAAPWYLRSWVLTGNPFFSHAIPGGFSTNPIHSALHTFYKEIFSFSTLNIEGWGNLIKALASGAGLAILIGTGFGLANWRETAPLLLTTATVILLWMFSVPQTAGGAVYSTRVLAPAIIPLSIMAGIGLDRQFGDQRLERKMISAATSAALFFCTLYAILMAISHPLPYVDLSIFMTKNSATPKFCANKKKLVDQLVNTGIHPCGILTFDPYVATLLKRETGFKPIMIWNPAVQFVFDKNRKPDEIRNRLLAADIRLVALSNEDTNQTFAFRFPFYQSYPSWYPVVEAGDDAIFSLAARPAIFNNHQK